MSIHLEEVTYKYYAKANFIFIASQGAFNEDKFLHTIFFVALIIQFREAINTLALLTLQAGT